MLALTFEPVCSSWPTMYQQQPEKPLSSVYKQQTTFQFLQHINKKSLSSVLQSDSSLAPIWVFKPAALMLLSRFDTVISPTNPSYTLLTRCKCCRLTVAPSDGSWHEAASIYLARSWSANVSRLTSAHTRSEPQSVFHIRVECQDRKFCVRANPSPIQSLFHCIGRT